MTTIWSEQSISDLRKVLGNVDDTTLTAILELNPTFEEIEEAIMWLDGRAEKPANGGWPLVGHVGEIFEILVAGAEGKSQIH